MWSADVVIKQGDRYPPVQSQLLDANGDGIDLTQFAVARFVMAESVGVSPSINSTVSAASTAGNVSYAWSTGDTSLDSGHYFWEFKVWDAQSKRLTVPNGSYGTCEIVTALSTA